jgi:hypothetical protein
MWQYLAGYTSDIANNISIDTFTSLFPSLEEIHIDVEITRGVSRPGSRYSRAFVVEKIQKKEGKETRVVFRDE